MTSHWDFSASSPATTAMGVWCAGIPTGWCWAIRCWSLSLDTKRNAGPATGNSPHRPCLQHRPGCGPCWFAWWSSCWNRILRHHRGGGPHHLLPRQRNRRPAPSGVRWFRLYLGDDRASSVVMGTGRHRLWRLPVAEPMHFGHPSAGIGCVPSWTMASPCPANAQGRTVRHVRIARLVQATQPIVVTD